MHVRARAQAPWLRVPPGGWDAGVEARRAVRRPCAEPADDPRRAGHGLVRGRYRQRKARFDSPDHWRWCGWPSGYPFRQADEGASICTVDRHRFAVLA